MIRVSSLRILCGIALSVSIGSTELLAAADAIAVQGLSSGGQGGSGGVGLHPVEVWEQPETVSLPEGDALAVLREDEDVAFPNSLSAEKRERLLHQRASNSPPPELLAYRQMIHVAPTTIVTA